MYPRSVIEENDARSPSPVAEILQHEDADVTPQVSLESNESRVRTAQKRRGWKNHLRTRAEVSMRRGERDDRQASALVLAGLVPLFERLLDLLLGILTSRHFLEGLRGDNTLQRLELESVTGRQDVRVVDGLNREQFVNTFLCTARPPAPCSP